MSGCLPSEIRIATFHLSRDTIPICKRKNKVFEAKEFYKVRMRQCCNVFKKVCLVPYYGYLGTYWAKPTRSWDLLTHRADRHHK